MPTVDIAGIVTRYEISGSGPPILMMAPGGFDSAIEKWSTTWPWQHFLPLQAFAKDYTCIAYDRREAGQSGGRVERLTWAAYADQAMGLLDHLGITSLKLPALILPGIPTLTPPRVPAIWRSVSLAPSIGTCISNPNPQISYGITFWPSSRRMWMQGCAKGCPMPPRLWPLRLGVWGEAGARMLRRVGAWLYPYDDRGMSIGCQSPYRTPRYGF